jgi:hypothetical protein
VAGETPASEPTEPGPETGETQGDRIGTLEGKVDQILDRLASLIPGHHAEPAADETEGEAPVAEQVKAELAKLKAAEDRKARADKRDGELAELRQKVEQIREKPPKEYRKVTTAVWGRDED